MSAKYVILAQYPDGRITIYGESGDYPEIAITFNSMKEIHREIRDSIMLQGLPIQIVKLDMDYFEGD